MASDPLERLGEILVTRVRDKAIADWDKILDGRMKGNTATRVREELGRFGPNSNEVLASMVPRVVDTVLHHLLWTLEQEESLEVSLTIEGTSMPSARDASDGLCGELYGIRGWIARFSQERHDET